MNKRRLGWLLLIVAAALSGLFLWRRGVHRSAAEKEETVVTEVAVQVGKITRATLHAYVLAYGVVEPEPASAGTPAASAHVASSVPGIIAVANCVEGQRVEKGVALFRLDTRVADVAVEKARVAVDFAEKTLARQRRLLKVDGTSQKLLEEAQQQLDAAHNELAHAQAQRALHTVTAPLAGMVVRVNAKPGETVDPTTELAEVIDMERLVVSANIPSAELPALKVGQRVELSAERPAGTHESDAPAVPQGILRFIGLQVDPKTGAAPARISIPARTGLRPGQYISVRIVTQERPDRLVVPTESVVKADDASVVAIVEGDKAIQKPVTVGLRENNLTGIEGDGLQEGMTVVTKGAYGLPKETKIRVVDH